MAIFRNSPIVGSISGSVGGSNFVAGRGSPVVRQRGLKSRNTSAFAQAAQAKNALVRVLWRQLSANSRLAWNIGANNLSRTNRLGVQRRISGWQFYMSHAMFLEPDEIVALTEPPLFIKAPNYLPPAVVFVAGGPYEITLNVPTGGPLQFALIYGSRSMRPSVPKFFKNFKFIVRFAQTPNPVNVFDEWVLRFGELISGEFFAVDTRRFFPGNLVSNPVRVIASLP